MPTKTGGGFLSYLILAFWLGVFLAGVLAYQWLKRKFGKFF